MNQELMNPHIHLIDNLSPGSGDKHQQEVTILTKNDPIIDFGSKLGLGRYFFSIACFYVVGVLLHHWSENPDDSDGFLEVAVIGSVIALVLPCYLYGFIDLRLREVVVQKGFGPLMVSNRRRPLTDFKSVVVRHIGDSESDAFTASVGLKPKDGSPVQWVKDFSSNEEEVSEETVKFATQLGSKVDLPVFLCGRPI